MQFIKNGPDIPEDLLQAHEDGRVVFFCGAGISSPAMLPGFKGLVDKLYDGLGVARSSIEQAAIGKEQYDTAIGLLEGRIAGGRATVREQLVHILTPDLSAPKAMATHEALLTLAKTRKGRYRLITTNFDRLFEEVCSRNKMSLNSFHAPFLPVPKNRWDGLVYLHGLLPATPNVDDLNHLVISSGDFGLAYLTERWAARFVSELFRNYKVCFIGYSINDPVLRYMMDALAADKLLGEDPCKVFAFGSYSKGKEDEAKNEWNAKNVTPILYRQHDNHTYLHKTIREWAATYKSGVLGKEHIIVQYAMTKPLNSTKQDDFVGRMLWALSDLSGMPAKRFAEQNPPPSLEWLEPLADSRFLHEDLARFGVQPNTDKDIDLVFSLVSRPTPYPLAPLMTLVFRGHTVFSNWDKVMHQLALWLIRHLDDRKLILWVSKGGGVLPHQFARLIELTLAKTSLSPPMHKLWRLALSGRLQRRAPHLELHGWCRCLKREGLTPILRLQLRDLLTPCVLLRDRIYGLDGDDDIEKRKPQHVRDLVEWEIVLNADHVHSSLGNLAKNEKWQESVHDLLCDATALLRETLDLMHELDGVDDLSDRSYIHQPSISKHDQNKGFNDWTALIDLARDAWLATETKSPVQAKLEAERWFCIPYPVFKRLSFFAATYSSLITPRKALDWLLSKNGWWLWSVETEREALRLLVTIIPKLEATDRDVLGQAILQGPPRSMFREDSQTDQLQRIYDREIWLRLAKYDATGAKLSVDASLKLSSLSVQYPEWKLVDNERDEFPFWMGDDEDWRKFLSTPKSCKELVKWLREHPKSDVWQEDDWGERCKRDFRRTTVVLVHLASRGEWVIERWREALQAWSDEILGARSWHCVGSKLAIAPDNVVKEIAHSLSWWLQSIAKTFSGNEKTFFLLIRRVLELHRAEATQFDDDPVFVAINHPIGHVTEAALRWWYRKSLEDGQGLSDDLKPIFTDLCNTNVASFQYARLLLATHVIALFRVDIEWSKQHLLPLFDWELSVIEARSAWEGFLWSPRLYRPLMETIKPQFLATAGHYADLGTHGAQYASLLTFAALEPGDTFTKSELFIATSSLPSDGLHEAAQALVRALEGAGEQRTEYWRNRILPYLKSIWPKSRDNVTPSISKSFARLCIAAKDDFPEALHELKRWLQPPEYPDFVVNLLHEADLCKRFPLETLVFLDAMIGDNTQWPPENLKDCLEAIENAQQGLRGDIRFERLREYLRRHDVA